MQNTIGTIIVVDSLKQYVETLKHNAKYLQERYDLY